MLCQMAAASGEQHRRHDHGVGSAERVQQRNQQQAPAGGARRSKK